VEEIISEKHNKINIKNSDVIELYHDNFYEPQSYGS